MTSTFTAEEVSSIVAERSARDGSVDDDDLVTRALEFIGRPPGHMTVPWTVSHGAAARRARRRSSGWWPGPGYPGSRWSTRPEDITGYLRLKDVLLCPRTERSI